MVRITTTSSPKLQYNQDNNFEVFINTDLRLAGLRKNKDNLNSITLYFVDDVRHYESTIDLDEIFKFKNWNLRMLSFIKSSSPSWKVLMDTNVFRHDWMLLINLHKTVDLNIHRAHHFISFLASCASLMMLIIIIILNNFFYFNAIILMISVIPVWIGGHAALIISPRCFDIDYKDINLTGMVFGLFVLNNASGPVLFIMSGFLVLLFMMHILKHYIGAFNSSFILDISKGEFKGTNVVLDEELSLINVNYV
jgi:hypothetical protein